MVALVLALLALGMVPAMLWPQYDVGMVYAVMMAGTMPIQIENQPG